MQFKKFHFKCLQHNYDKKCVNRPWVLFDLGYNPFPRKELITSYNTEVICKLVALAFKATTLFWLNSHETLV